LLERPWQFDMKATHDVIRNRYTIIKYSKDITHVSLIPTGVWW
jgi:hypothetical protein